MLHPFLTRLLLSITLLAASPAFAQLLSFQQLLDRPDRPKADQRIAYGDDASQFGELWLPRGAGPHPVVLMIHGGCWQASLPGPELLAFQADALRSAGVAVWSISYRRVGHAGGGYPGTFQDVARGTDRLRQLATQYPLDLTRLVATGHSAGGHLALWAAARPRIAVGSPLHAASPLPIAAVVAVAGVPDLAFASRQGLCGKSVSQLLDLDTRGQDAAVWADVSPAALLPLHVRQTLVHGIYDGIVPPVQGHGYRAKATQLGDAVEIVNLDEAGHFELIAPWTPAGRQVVDRLVRATRAP
ncbi:alpha/beta hydrolase [Roseateles sp.]|uniref:alpha/beta hydrolase n=1 Tax=Roseateles sp. TaxID=1971397 RepID=UPI003BA8C34F